MCHCKSWWAYKWSHLSLHLSIWFIPVTKLRNVFSKFNNGGANYHLIFVDNTSHNDHLSSSCRRSYGSFSPRNKNLKHHCTAICRSESPSMLKANILQFDYIKILFPCYLYFNFSFFLFVKHLYNLLPNNVLTYNLFIFRHACTFIPV